MAKRRKTISMVVEVTVPLWMTATDARREVRSLINHQANWLSGKADGDKWREIDEKTVRAKAVRSVRAHVERA